MVSRYVTQLIFVALGFALAAPAQAACDLSEPAATTCSADLVVLSDEDSGAPSLWQFQTPTINANGDVGYIALLDPASFSYGVFLKPANDVSVEIFPRGGTAEGSFAGVRVSTLDILRTYAMDGAGNLFGPANVLDEFGFPAVGLVRGGPGGFALLPDPSFPEGTFLNPDSTTRVLVNDAGTYGFASEIRADSGATIVGEGLFRGDAANGTSLVLQTGDAAPDAGETYLGFFSSSNDGVRSLNANDDFAFAAIVSGAGITLDTDERLIAESGTFFRTLASEGDFVATDTPGLSFGAERSGSTFGAVSYNTREDVAFLARMREVAAPSEYITGGVGGATDWDGLFVANRDLGVLNIAVRGDTPDNLFDTLRLEGTQFITGVGRGQLNDRGDLAFFANAGPAAGDLQSLGLFVYNIEFDTFETIFQTSGSTIDDVLALGDEVDGLTFVTSDAYLNELAINNSGDVAFTSEVIAGRGSRSQRGLFFAANGAIDTLALVGSTIEVGVGDVRTISQIDFIGHGTAGGRPTGFSDNGTVAFTLVFAEGGSGVFTDSLEFVPVVDFLWSGDCGTVNWHDGCAATNWDDRITGDDAPRAPGSDAADRVFINDASVVITDTPVALFSISATGSLEVGQNLILDQASSIEDLILDADLILGSTLRLSGANGVWRSGDISGAGGLLLEGSTLESGRLVVDTSGTVRLGTGLEVAAIGDFAIDRGTLVLDSTAGITVNGLEASITFGGGTVAQGAGNASLYAIENTGQLAKGSSATSIVEAGYQQTAGVAVIGGGELRFSGPTLLGIDVQIDAGARLAFVSTDAVIWQGAGFSGAGVISIGDADVVVAGETTVDLVDDGFVELADGADLDGNELLTLTEQTALRKIGDGEAVLQGTRLLGSVDLISGSLAVGSTTLNGAEITVGQDATMVLIETDDSNIIQAEVIVDGEGFVTVEGSVESAPGDERDDLFLYVDSVIQSATFAGRNIAQPGPFARVSDFRVVNASSMAVADGFTASFEDAILQNGVDPRALDDRPEASGVFVLGETSTLNFGGISEFINRPNGSATLLGTIGLQNDPTRNESLTILSRGQMLFGATVAFEPSSQTVVLVNDTDPAAPNSSAGIMEIIGREYSPFEFMNEGRTVLAPGTVLPGDVTNGEFGVIEISGGAVELSSSISARGFSNLGRVRVTDGSLTSGRWAADVFQGSSSRTLATGSWEVVNGRISGRFGLGQEIDRIDSGVEVSLTGPDTAFFNFPATSRTLDLGGDLRLQDILFQVRGLGTQLYVESTGLLVVGADARVLAPLLQNFGRIQIDGGTLEAERVFNSGELGIGASPGSGTIDGDFINAGAIDIEIAGTAAGTEYDQLIVNGTTTFEDGGVINITLLDPDENDGIDEVFRPRTGDVFEFLVTEELILSDGQDLASLITFTNAPGGLRFDFELAESNGMLSFMLMAQFGLDPDALASLSGNRAAIGNYLQGVLLGDALDGDPRRDTLSDLATLDAVALAAATAELHPEIYALAPALAAYERSWALTEAFGQQMRLRRSDASAGVWLTGLGGAGALDGSSSRGTSDVDGDHQGVIFGGDVPLDADRSAYVGAFIGAERHDQSFDDLPARQEYEGLVFGVYGGFAAGDVDLTAMLAYQNGETDSRRSAPAISSRERTRGTYDVDGWTAQLAARWPALWAGEHLALRPQTALTYAQFDRDGLTETGSTFALDVARDRFEGLFAEAGFMLSGAGDSSSFKPALGLGWRYDLDHEDESAAARLAGLSGASFDAAGAHIPRSMGYLNATLAWALQDRVQLYLEYDAVFANNYLSHSGQFGLRWDL